MLIGVVGKPSAGKSTFFKSATLADVEIANYPFTTIKPNRGTAFVKVLCVDKEFNAQCNPRIGYCKNQRRFIPAELLDVAGLVPGAHEGKGMGNQFLDDLNQAHVLIHVIDVSGSVNEKGEPVEPLSYDPANDINFLEYELDMWYLRSIEKGWEKFVRTLVQERGELHRAITKQLSFLRVTEEITKEAIRKLDLPEDIKSWNKGLIMKFASELRKQTKPIIVACNKIDIPGAEKNYERLKVQFPEHLLVPCSSEAELALKEAAKHGLIDYLPGEKEFNVKDESKLNDKQRNALNFIKVNVLDKFGSSGVQDVIDKSVFEILKYVAIFPGGVNKLGDQYGNILPDCFLLPHNSTALDFAYKLHTDIGDHFVKAIDVRSKRPVGKDHVLKHRDVVEIATSK